MAFSFLEEWDEYDASLERSDAYFYAMMQDKRVENLEAGMLNTFDDLHRDESAKLMRQNLSLQMENDRLMTEVNRCNEILRLMRYRLMTLELLVQH